MQLIKHLNAIVESNKKQTFTDKDEWMAAVKKQYASIADKIVFKGRVEDGKHLFYAEIPGEDRAYGVFNVDDDDGVVLGEGSYGGVYRPFDGRLTADKTKYGGVYSPMSEGQMKDQLIDAIEAAEKYLDTPEEIYDFIKDNELFRGMQKKEVIEMIKGVLGD